MYRFGRITLMDYHRNMGKYYAYPKCCVDNFVKIQKMNLAAYAHMMGLYGECPIDNGGHVLCFECRIMRRR